ncbi:MAG: GspE/PulE family protein [bacterium]
MESEQSTSFGNIKIDKAVAQILSEEIVRRINMLPIRIEGEYIYVAASAPVNIPGLDEIKLLTGLKVKPVIVSKNELDRIINSQFSTQQTSKQAIVDMTIQELKTFREVSSPEESMDVDEAPVVALVNSIIRGAVNDNASDIHLEPQFPEMRVRYRINGLLHDVTTVPRYIEPSIISRIKLLADMDITERRRPQDGHITVNVGNKQVDLRVSSILTINGEKIVIRVLDKDTMLVDLNHLGLSDDQQRIFRSFISHPYGMILVTGPTGSGKSTTLYAVLKEIDSKTRNIITIENPVEYQMPRITQIQVNPAINLTFASALRTILRQDPDVIMVGEIRDTETAEIAIQAALTGHLVFSTLHTNDAPSAVVRLLDMGIQPFLTSSAVIGVIAQRLVRTICPECKEFYQPSKEELELLGTTRTDIKLAKGCGCPLCKGTGYRGRTAVYEIFEIDESIRRLIVAQAPTSEIRKMAIAKGMKSLSQMGREKILQGVSTLEEVHRVIHLGEESFDKLSEEEIPSQQDAIKSGMINIPEVLQKVIYLKEDHLSDQFEIKKKAKDCYISFEGNQYSVPYQYDKKELTVKIRGKSLAIYHNDQIIATHQLSQQEGQLVTDHTHFLGMPKFSYPNDTRALKEVFLAYFPDSIKFIDGLERTKNGNVRNHIVRILSLLDEYPRSVIESAIKRVTVYEAFEYKAIKNICSKGLLLEPLPKDIESSELKIPPVAETVEVRPLSYYSQFEV